MIALDAAIVSDGLLLDNRAVTGREVPAPRRSVSSLSSTDERAIQPYK
jgi:hypothetical protein